LDRGCPTPSAKLSPENQEKNMNTIDQNEENTKHASAPSHFILRPSPMACNKTTLFETGIRLDSLHIIVRRRGTS
jgi:hypothetical protein